MAGFDLDILSDDDMPRTQTTVPKEGTVTRLLPASRLTLGDLLADLGPDREPSGSVIEGWVASLRAEDERLNKERRKANTLRIRLGAVIDQEIKGDQDTLAKTIRRRWATRLCYSDGAIKLMLGASRKVAWAREQDANALAGVVAEVLDRPWRDVPDALSEALAEAGFPPPARRTTQRTSKEKGLALVDRRWKAYLTAIQDLDPEPRLRAVQAQYSALSKLMAEIKDEINANPAAAAK